MVWLSFFSDDLSECVYLKQMLVGQVVPGVQFEYEHVVDPSLPPAIRVNAQQEEELNEQEAATIHPHHRPDVLIMEENSTWMKNKQVINMKI